ncbi:NADH-quinone oxidoreductase subunit J [bacterium]|nr:NADH-quinone oxidoreductase subunit J [bacterium]
MPLVFVILSALLIASAVGVILFRNPIHSALCLVVNLVGVACVFAALEAHFLAVVQVIVYAGAIMVLVVFVLMLLNSKTEERTLSGVIQLVLSGIIGGCLVSVVGPFIIEQWPIVAREEPPISGSVEALGKVLYTDYIFPFETAGFLVMAALVAAAMLAKTKGGDPNHPRISEGKNDGTIQAGGEQ